MKRLSPEEREAVERVEKKALAKLREQPLLGARYVLGTHRWKLAAHLLKNTNLARIGIVHHGKETSELFTAEQVDRIIKLLTSLRREMP